MVPIIINHDLIQKLVVKLLRLGVLVEAHRLIWNERFNTSLSFVNALHEGRVVDLSRVFIHLVDVEAITPKAQLHVKLLFIELIRTIVSIHDAAEFLCLQGDAAILLNIINQRQTRLIQGEVE